MLIEEPPTSQQIAALQRDIGAGKAGSLDEFWQTAIHRGTPIIESIEGDSQHALVTFLWRDVNSAANPAVVFVAAFPAEKEPMTHIAGTDVWFKTYTVARDMLETYQIAFGESNLLDPLNSRTHVFAEDEERDFKGWKSSIVELPDARPQPWSTPIAGTPAGSVTLHRFQSKVMGDERRVWIYTPHSYSPQNEPYGLMLVFDGWFYIQTVPVPAILDNLIAADRIPPLVTVLVGSLLDETRGRDLTCYPPYFKFLTEELLPWVRANYHVTTDPSKSVVAGASAGGIAAAFAGLRWPDIFGNVLSNSGAFGWAPEGETEGEWFPRQYAEGARLPLQFHLDAGAYELWTPRPGRTSLLLSNRHFRDVLKAKGYPVHYQEFSGGHSPINWRGTFAEGLLALIGTT